MGGGYVNTDVRLGAEIWVDECLLLCQEVEIWVEERLLLRQKAEIWVDERFRLRLEVEMRVDGRLLRMTKAVCSLVAFPNQEASQSWCIKDNEELTSVVTL